MVLVGLSDGFSASTDSWFDANGVLVATDRSESTPAKPLGNALVNDAQGRVLYNNQGAARPFDTNTAGFGRIENQAGGFIGGFIGNDSNRGHMQRQLIVNGEVLARYGDELVAKINSMELTPTSVAEFQFGAAPLNVRQTNLDAQRYTVTGGETLRSIARAFYGDDKLWYLIAQANGLSGSTQLSTGQTLSIPKLSASSNAADSFKPYDPSKVVGDLTPNLPMPQNDKGCGALGQIIMIVVAIVVTIYTAGAAATSLSSAAAASSAAGASTMSIGAGALLGGTGAAAGMSAGSLIAAGAIGGAVGSIASQLVGNAIGAVDGFSWKGVALGGLSAGMGAGLGQIAALAGTTPGAVIVRAAIGNAMTQGIAVATGLQTSFDWKGVAASAVGAGVGYGMNEALGLTTNGAPTNNFAGFDKFARAGLSGLAAGTAAAVARGGRVSVQQVATDAFGNALGSAVVDAMMPQNSAQQSFRSSEIAEQNENTPAYSGGGLRLGRGGTGLRLSDDALSSWSNGVDNGIAAAASSTDVYLSREQEDRLRSGQTMSDVWAPNESDGLSADAAGALRRAGKSVLKLDSNLDPKMLELQSNIRKLQALQRGVANLQEEMTASSSAPAGTGLRLSGNDSGLGLSTRFVQGAFHGAVDMVWQPVAQVLDLTQVVGGGLYGLTTGGAYEPHWFSGIGQNYAGGMGYGETITRAVLGSNPVTGVGMASYDLTSSAMRSDWGGVAEGLGGLAGGFGAAKFGQSYFRPEPGPGAQLGVYRVRPQVEIPDSSPGGLLGPLPSWESPNFSTAEPVHIGGKPIYRVSDGVFGDRTKAQVNGGYWADEPAPSTEGAWRSKYAVLNEWPNRGGTEGSWTPSGSWAWGGKAAPQAVTGAYREFNVFGSTYRAGWIQAGGGYQIWVPNSYKIITPSMVTLSPTPWNN